MNIEKSFMVDIKKDDDLARPSPTLAHPRSPSPTLAPSFNLATLSTLATLAYTLHLADSFSHTCFQNCMTEWNLSDETIKNSPTISVFKRELVHLVRPSKKSYSGIHDIEEIRLLTRLRVHFSDLRKHKFRHKFQCFSMPVCLCQTGTENNEHLFLRCPRHSNHRKDLIDRISNVVNVDIGNLSSIDLCNLLLNGNSRLSFDTNHHIIELTITFIKSTTRFKQI